MLTRLMLAMLVAIGGFGAAAAAAEEPASCNPADFREKIRNVTDRRAQIYYAATMSSTQWDKLDVGAKADIGAAVGVDTLPLEFKDVHDRGSNLATANQFASLLTDSADQSIDRWSGLGLEAYMVCTKAQSGLSVRIKSKRSDTHSVTLDVRFETDAVNQFELWWKPVGSEAGYTRVDGRWLPRQNFAIALAWNPCIPQTITLAARAPAPKGEVLASVPVDIGGGIPPMVKFPFSSEKRGYLASGKPGETPAAAAFPGEASPEPGWKFLAETVSLRDNAPAGVGRATKPNMEIYERGERLVKWWNHMSNNTGESKTVSVWIEGLQVAEDTPIPVPTWCAPAKP
jgi:hypothetical protein